MILRTNDLDTIGDFFGRNTSLDLVYRGSREGFNYDAWKEKVKTVGNMITVIKSEHGKLFGGYISKPLDFSGNNRN